MCIRGWQCMRFWVSYTRVWGDVEADISFWGGSLWSSRFLRSSLLFFLLRVAALLKKVWLSLQMWNHFRESMCVWEAGLRLWSVGFRSIWEHAEASPCPKAPWEGLGFGPLVNETPVLVRLEIAQQKLQERGTAHASSRKTNSPHSTSDNAFQLLFFVF